MSPPTAPISTVGNGLTARSCTTALRLCPPSAIEEVADDHGRRSDEESGPERLLDVGL